MLIKSDIALSMITSYLAITGPADAKQVCKALKISQATFSRLTSKNNMDLLKIGSGPKTVYAKRRSGAWGSLPVTVYMIDEKGKAGMAAKLHPLSPRGIYIESKNSKIKTRLYENLPYYMDDLRPAGFLGRLIPVTYAQMGFPQDIDNWSEDDVLLYLTRCGPDIQGNYIFGDDMLGQYRQSQNKNSSPPKKYPELAESVLKNGLPGSSAAGEQPKFMTAYKEAGKWHHVMVKFSPPVKDEISIRIADLLACEDLALKLLNKNGKGAVQSRLLKMAKRFFLETIRFDRVDSAGRIGMISLRALDMELVGSLRSWSETAQALLKIKIINKKICEDIIWLDCFGSFIANTDRHPGNISFYCEGEKITGLAPVYDMLPMLYAPQQNQLHDRVFNASLTGGEYAECEQDALKLACKFWEKVQEHRDISGKFKKITKDNILMLKKLYASNTR